jgi:hypothetical protein
MAGDNEGTTTTTLMRYHLGANVSTWSNCAIEQMSPESYTVFVVMIRVPFVRALLQHTGKPLDVEDKMRTRHDVVLDLKSLPWAVLTIILTQNDEA